MTAKDFGDTYLRYQESIKKVLNSKKIYDEDLLHDTYIALYEHSQRADMPNFPGTFVEFYMARYKRREVNESNYEAYSPEQMAALDIIDESDLAYREQTGKRVDNLIRYFCEHPQKGVRSHRRACKVLRLYRQGLTECEISHMLKISQSAVHQQLESIIERLKLIAKR
jgi:Response regulator containing a CheY-like receiver domain and an HTH DNA-binding domain